MRFSVFRCVDNEFGSYSIREAIAAGVNIGFRIVRNPNCPDRQPIGHDRDAVMSDALSPALDVCLRTPCRFSGNSTCTRTRLRRL